MASTVTLQTVVNFAATHSDLLPLSGVGGFTNEPALSLANDVLQELLSSPYNWKFNRIAAGILVLQRNRQDNLFAGATAFTAAAGGVGIGLAATLAISESGTTVTVNTLQPHNFAVGQTVFLSGCTVAAYNSTFSQLPDSSGWTGGFTILTTPTTTSFTFTHTSSGLGTSGAAGITDFGWLESGTFSDTQETSPAPLIRYTAAVRTLQPSSMYGLPDTVSIVSQTATGILTVRFRNVPGQTAWGVLLVYQARAPLKTALTETWAPFPDELGFAYRQAFLARSYRFINNPRADVEYQKAQLAAQKALGADDNEDTDERVSPETSLMGTFGMTSVGWGY